MIKINTGSLKSTWYVWLFPLFAVLICVWLFVNYISNKGPRIKILFEDGANIQAEKTQVRFRGVPVGIVRDIQISEDTKQVIAVVDLDKNAQHFAVEGSKFWVVLPKVSLQGVTGLETILEGPYIAVTPGKDDDKEKDEFKGRVGSDQNDPTEDTSVYTLETNSVESVGTGDPVTFRGLQVGTVGKVTLSKSAQAVHVQINVQNKYVKLIRTNTVFWRKVAVQANLGLFNSEVKINSLESMLRGGIEFFTPSNPGEIAKSSTKFGLQAGPPKDVEKWNPNLDL
ncbi:Paraquat-inducible protein B [compost metagenome]